MINCMATPPVHISQHWCSAGYFRKCWSILQKFRYGFFCSSSHFPVKSSQESLISDSEQTSTLSVPIGSYSNDNAMLPNSCTINFVHVLPPPSKYPKGQGILLNVSLLCSSHTLPAPTRNPSTCASWDLKNTWPALWGNMINSVS